jgi:predicted phosphatase|tara:strand:- start:395 stop:634 length:240 start_codon:yes stop_codon:yes gene_type:complete
MNRNTKKSSIKELFNLHNFGTIENIDLILLGKNKRAFIYYSSWNNNEKSIKVKNILENGEDFKIMYNMPWFWKCVKALN